MKTSRSGSAKADKSPMATFVKGSGPQDRGIFAFQSYFHKSLSLVRTPFHRVESRKFTFLITRNHGASKNHSQ